MGKHKGVRACHKSTDARMEGDPLRTAGRPLGEGWATIWGYYSHLHPHGEYLDFWALVDAVDARRREIEAARAGLRGHVDLRAVRLQASPAREPDTRGDSIHDGGRMGHAQPETR